MLTEFVVVKVFNKLNARLRVDRLRQDAEITITYDRRVRRIQDVAYHEVSTPEAADRWFSRSASNPEHGSWLEFHERMCARDPNWLVNQGPVS